MPNYNYCILAGHVGRDPELRYTESGVAVADFSLAVNTGWGENKRTVWAKVTAWRQKAELVNQYVTKGMAIMVAGEVSVSAWLGSDGEARAELALTAKEIVFLSSQGEPENAYETDR